MRTTIIGLGLIGGSMAIDLRKNGLVGPIIGVDQNERHVVLAKQLGIVDDVLPEREALAQADLVILAIPVNAMVVMLPSILEMAGPDTVVFDTGSTKQQICRAVASHTHRARFVASHPVAGTENSGPTAALSGLFNGKTNIICERELSSERAIETSMSVFDALGMKTIFMDPDEHDRHVAYVSHLSHVSSFLLGQTVLDMEKDEKNIFNLAGSGFASTVRLAKSSPEMWTPIFEQNSEYLSQALLEYIMHLQRFHYHLMKKDSKELHRIMTQANDIRRILDGFELKQVRKNEINDTK